MTLKRQEKLGEVGIMEVKEENSRRMEILTSHTA